MRDIPLVIILTAFLMFVGCSTTRTGSLSFQAPQDWKVNTKRSDFYSVSSAPDQGFNLLILSKSTHAGDTEEFSISVQDYAQLFQGYAQTSSMLALSSEEYQIEQFAGAHCHGSYAAFELNEGKLVHAMFMLGVDGEVWRGQFTGSSNAWKQALPILKSIKIRPDKCTNAEPLARQFTAMNHPRQPIGNRPLKNRSRDVDVTRFWRKFGSENDLR